MRPRSPGRALRHDGRARLRLRPPARHAARAGAHRRAHRAAQPPRVPRDAERRARGRDPADRPLSVVVLDLDHFKSINDVYGHARGRQGAHGGAAELRAAVREDDTVARLGGEEFALILPGVDGDGAAEAAERARAAIAGVEVAGAGLSCSAGVAAFPEDAHDAARLLELADGALYWAKRSGRDQAAVTTAARRPALRRRASAPRSRRCWRARTRSSRVPARAGARHGARRRLRGARPDARRPVPAARPVVQPGAPRRARPGARGRRAARRAAGRAAGRSGRSSRSTSARAPSSRPRCAPRCRRTSTGIVIELTEHELFSADRRSTASSTRLRARGARIALDDAGNGYAGLQQIIRIAPDILKLDRSLVDGIHDDPHRFALLEALISFAVDDPRGRVRRGRRDARGPRGARGRWT